MIRSTAAFLLGAAAWTAAEYAIHRFVGHGPKRSPPASRLGRVGPAGLAYEFNGEHLAHHADPTYFAPTSRKLLAASVALPAAAIALSPILGVRGAASFVGGFGVAYGAYEVLHRRIHTHPPRGAYGRWMRRHHLAHHYKTPRANHGVTSPVWDRVFATEKPVARLRVPRKAAPVWLEDDDADYELAGVACARRTFARSFASLTACARALRRASPRPRRSSRGPRGQP